MKYFIDFEFIEGLHKSLFGKRRHFIDLISVGIVGEDGREYYAISNEFNPKDADGWVKDNVINSLPDKKVSFYDSPRVRQEALYWKSNSQIAKEIIKFCDPTMFLHNNAEPDLEFYGYYADYDWVLLCSLFGRMIDLPKGFPMYCKDLKQILDQKAILYTPLNLDANLKMITDKPNYPKQSNEHNALVDAKWNRELYKFLKTINYP